MIVSSNAGLVDSYNSGRITRFSYSNFIHGFKFDLGRYSQSDPGVAYLYYDFYIKYLNINGNTIINTDTFLGSFDDVFANLSYRDDGYGLGIANMIDAINNSNLFAPYGITFHPAGYKIAIRTREKTRFSVVFWDDWSKEGEYQGVKEWTLIGNYPSSSDYPDKQLAIADWIGNFILDFNGQDIQSVVDINGSATYWS